MDRIDADEYNIDQIDTIYDVFDRFRSSPAWPARVASAHTVTREARAEEGYTFDMLRFKGLHTPTLLLTGEEHIAMYTAPELFIHEVVDFLREER